MPIATKSSKIDISLETNTKSISKKFSKYLKRGDVVFLIGEIGVGKTTFIKHLINNLQLKSNIKETEVPSPTFNLIYEYKIKDLIIKHCDLYRINSEIELKNIGIFENCENSITFIEWPEIINNKPKNRIELVFKYEENLKKRSLTIFCDCRKEIINEFQ